MSNAAQIAANRVNAKHSTGPQTEEGKAASAQNNFRHGLSGAFIIQPWENADQYIQFLFDLRAEHQPATLTESLLVERMAQHWWLGQRALRLQEFCFHEKAPMVNLDLEKELALYLRYQTTHERAFSKCLNDLTNFRAEQRKADERLERLALAARTQEASLKRQEAAETRKTEAHTARLQSLAAKTKLDEARTARQNSPNTAKTPMLNLPASNSVSDRIVTDVAQVADFQTIMEKNAA